MASANGGLEVPLKIFTCVVNYGESKRPPGGGGRDCNSRGRESKVKVKTEMKHPGRKMVAEKLRKEGESVSLAYIELERTKTVRRGRLSFAISSRRLEQYHPGRIPRLGRA